MTQKQADTAMEFYKNMVLLTESFKSFKRAISDISAPEFCRFHELCLGGRPLEFGSTVILWSRISDSLQASENRKNRREKWFTTYGFQHIKYGQVGSHSAAKRY